MKAKYLVAVLAVMALLILGGAPAVAKSKPELPSNGEMYGWIKDLTKIGDQNLYGYRMPGSDEDHAAANYVLSKFEEFGLQNTSLEPVSAPLSLPDTWSLTLRPGEQDQEVVPSSFGRYAGFTPPGGITTDIVYVGNGSAAEFAAANASVGLAGKLVVVNELAPPTPESAYDPLALFSYDPGGTLVGDNAIENWPPINMASSYALAKTYGTAGVVGILTFTVNDNDQYLHQYFDGALPVLFVSPNDGAELRSQLTAGPVPANMVLTGTNETGTTYNVYGFLPGKSDEIIVVESHYDGWATNEGSGTVAVMAIAKYLAQFPQESRERTIMFVLWSNHFGKKTPTAFTSSLAYSKLPSIVADLTVEMIGKQFKIIDGEYVDTGLISPVAFCITKKNPYLLQFASDAIVAHDLDRTRVINGGFAGEATKWVALGVPTIGRIGENAPEFTNDDRPNTVMASALNPTAAAFVDIIKKIDVTDASLLK